MYKKAIYLENISNLLTGRTCETLETLTDTRAGVACTTTTAVITSRGAVAGVLLNGVVRNRCVTTSTGQSNGFVPFADEDGVTLATETGRFGCLCHWVNQGLFVTRVGAPFLPLAVLFAGLFVHGIVRSRAFNGVAVDATETDVAQTTVLHTGIPSIVVRDKEVVVVRVFDQSGMFSVLCFEHSLGVVDSKVLVAAAYTVPRAVVRA